MASLKLGSTLSYALIFCEAVFSICIISYDAAMINNLNAVVPYRQHFELNSDMVGLNAAIISAGCIVGAPVVGHLVDRWGRKAGLGLGATSIIIGVILEASATKVAQLVCGRFLIGLATLINGSVPPMWIMELGAPRYKSMLANAVLVSAPFTAFFTTCIFLEIWDKQSNWAWRGIMLGEAVPSVLALCLLPFVDESPRWLFHRGRTDEAIEILARLHANGDRQHPLVIAETQEIMGTLEHEEQHDGGWKELIVPASNLKRFIIAVLINICYQIIGANAILYFSSFLIAGLGIENYGTIIQVNMGLLLWNAFCSLAGVFVIDKIGTRKALIFGTAATVVLFAILSGLSYLADQHPDDHRYAIGAIAVVGLFLLAVSFSWMLLAYTYPPEILKYSQRSKGVAISQAIGYAFSFLNLYTAPIAMEKIGWRYFAINGGWNLAILATASWLFVDTKGRTLEEIDEIFDGMGHTDGVIIGTDIAQSFELDTTGEAGKIVRKKPTLASTNTS
ncbi:hypothetical protein CLIM01_04774 [Colletotrichum limetticola]|uniref:Major facilitator superfamily (MFS) profile domain-containing protein n=1 Tax=Colletotrichum limetticola TaxID=1209924 RepID=A0ABQ9Q282_9PEZI|nr:hypothetical protein CLIM01_04774 [Colletotrichum limetticola]